MQLQNQASYDNFHMAPLLVYRGASGAPLVVATEQPLEVGVTLLTGHLTLPCHTMLYQVLPCLSLSYHILPSFPCYTMSYHVIPCFTIYWSVLPCVLLIKVNILKPSTILIYNIIYIFLIRLFLKSNFMEGNKCPQNLYEVLLLSQKQNFIKIFFKRMNITAPILS